MVVRKNVAKADQPRMKADELVRDEPGQSRQGCQYSAPSQHRLGRMLPTGSGVGYAYWQLYPSSLSSTVLAPKSKPCPDLFLLGVSLVSVLDLLRIFLYAGSYANQAC